jgi:hypothetical protein
MASHLFTDVVPYGVFAAKQQARKLPVPEISTRTRSHVMFESLVGHLVTRTVLAVGGACTALSQPACEVILLTEAKPYLNQSIITPIEQEIF